LPAVPKTGASRTSVALTNRDATILLLALFPVGVVVPAFAALALVSAVWVGLHAYELIWWRDARGRRRAEAS
jgi:hypothetical protein